MTDWKRLYANSSIMLDKYQNEIVPKLREELEKRVEVVRCKDCKWYAPSNDGLWVGCAFDTRNPDDVPKAYDFCSYGERKDNGKP